MMKLRTGLFSKITFSWLGSTFMIYVLALAPFTLLLLYPLLLTNRILFGIDSFLYFYPYQSFVSGELLKGHLPLWNPYLFMGAPLLANSQVGLFYPLNWLFIGLAPPQQMAWNIWLHLLLIAGFAALFARRSLGLSPAGALWAALMASGNGFILAQMTHLNQLQVAAYLPLLLLLLDELARAEKEQRRWLRLWLALALLLAVLILIGHPQSLYISLAGGGVFLFFRGRSGRKPPVELAQGENSTTHPAWRKRVMQAAGWLREMLPLKTLGLLLAAILFALMLTMIQLLPTLELSRLSIRAGGLPYREAASFSLRPGKMLFSFLPGFFDDYSQVFGEAYTEFVAYAGLSGLLAGLYGLILALKRKGGAFALAVMGAFGFFLAWGGYNPVYYLLYKFIPGFSLFRAPSRWLLLYIVAVALLGGLAVDDLVKREKALTAELGGWLNAQYHRCRPLARFGIAAGLTAAILAVVLVLELPNPSTALLWLLFFAGAAACLLRARKERASYLTALFLLAGSELLLMSRQLPHASATAPEAYSGMRPAVARLETEPGAWRFLSLSGIEYDPGDLAELQNILSPQLPLKAVYNYILAAKQKEVLFFNLPLQYGLYSVDGYDGGLLPIKDFVNFQRLFLPENELSVDGRLREKLHSVPDNRLLSLMGVRYIITDKVHDIWLKDIFYDLQFPAALKDGLSVSRDDLPDFPGTAIGLVLRLPQPAASGSGPLLQLKFAEAGKPDETADIFARDLGQPWQSDAASADYLVTIDLQGEKHLQRLQLAGQTDLQVLGVSLINQPTGTSRSIIISTAGNYRLVYSGDVKIYENEEALPRATLIHQVQYCRNEDEALAYMKSAGFDPRREITLVDPARTDREIVTIGDEHTQDEATVEVYLPEKIEVSVSQASAGYLLINDSYYPGWSATIDGAETEIWQADQLFRAVKVPAGRHHVNLAYSPASFTISKWLSLAAGVIGLLLWGAAVWRRKA